MSDLYLGIDGGGSNLRVVIVDSDLHINAQTKSDSANPSSIGREESARRIQSAIQTVLQEASLNAEKIIGAGIGVAGASADHAAAWLNDVVSSVLPASHIVPSSDHEIALVGAHGERLGALILAGTGSVAFAVNQNGETAQAGGWGYLVGDEGSGYWLGRQAISRVIRAHDGLAPRTNLTDIVLDALNLNAVPDLLQWLYQGESRVREIARLAPVVLDVSADVSSARTIVEIGAIELLRLCQAVIRRVNLDNPHIAFAGGLLDSPNPLSTRLCERLGLSDFPTNKYPPVVGAALLAKLRA
jgi:N-acetylglucosamine kinase-like BadF-type ATPase